MNLWDRTKNLWERTKSVAKMYTGTFIVVMVLNQLLFFGFCLNPICLIAAMPHVLLITVFIGSWLNKESGWGDEKQAGNVGEIYKEGKGLVVGRPKTAIMAQTS